MGIRLRAGLYESSVSLRFGGFASRSYVFRIHFILFRDACPLVERAQMQSGEQEWKWLVSGEVFFFMQLSYGESCNPIPISR
jgi:hypothetical protein